MAIHPVSPPHPFGPADRLMFRLLGFDPSEVNVAKWVVFARNLLAVFVASVAGLWALVTYNSISTTHAVMTQSLSAKGRAIVSAEAHAAFVPLSLKDEDRLERVARFHSADPDLAFVEVRDRSGRLAAEFARPELKAGGRLVELEAEVKPNVDYAEASSAPEQAAGTVRVGMSPRRIDRQLRAVAGKSVLGSGALLLLILSAGVVLIRGMTQNLRELVGEARLVDEVRQANAELEAFSYSVSHDLRAPLRGIAGYSQIILEDSAAGLDDAGKENFGKVVAATKLMGALIDDMLELSRVSRTELRRQTVDMTGQARSVLGELREREPSRRAEVLVADGLVADGDPQLLRIALENLIGNAWKYTGKRETARIEIGAAPGAKGETVFFVKDNGAGFDMAYSGRLFGAFQRLHSQAEFEGTGVGLATVQRIVRRHGGRIWAESAVEKGATFHFTL